MLTDKNSERLDKGVSVRIMVKDFNVKTMEWHCLRSERVAGHIPGSEEYFCYDAKLGETVSVFVYCLEWHSLRVVPMYEITIRQISKCLENLWLEEPLKL